MRSVLNNDERYEVKRLEYLYLSFQNEIRFKQIP